MRPYASGLPYRTCMPLVGKGRTGVFCKHLPILLFTGEFRLNTCMTQIKRLSFLNPGLNYDYYFLVSKHKRALMVVFCVV